ncbi:solute carrier family 23 protein, partial [Coprococcus eutactus]|uniref:solute carrier family 23 protein n=1 Tax=Coprococcus eutactus TaxID=33043 RepID=UPI00210E25C3
DAASFNLPEFYHIGLPKFEIKSCILKIFIYIIVLLDTTGTWETISAITGEDLSEKRIDRATIGEGVGCLVRSLFGGT